MHILRKVSMIHIVIRGKHIFIFRNYQTITLSKLVFKSETLFTVLKQQGDFFETIYGLRKCFTVPGF